MKKALLCFLYIFVLLCAVFTEEVQQLIVPPELYVGDVGQLRYSFNTPIDFFALADSSYIKDDILYLNTDSSAFVSASGQYEVKEASLQRYGVTYTLLITFVAWQPGYINIPPFDLYEYCTYNSELDIKEPFTINLEPIFISSITEKTKDFALRPPVPPLLLPESKYFVLILGVIFFLILFALCWILIRFHFVIANILALKDKIGFMRNEGRTKKLLKSLLVKKYDDKDFASSWQQIMRSYLNNRFHTSFISVTSNNIFNYINSLTNGLLDNKAEEAAITLSSLFIRTDYIIFAYGSIDSLLLPAEEHRASFTLDERKEIVQKSIDCIYLFEDTGRKA